MGKNGKRDDTDGTKFFKENRLHTNVPFAYISLFFVATWIVASIYVLAAISPYKFVIDTHSIYHSIGKTILRNMIPILLFIPLFLLLELVYIILLKEMFAKFITWIEIIIKIVILILVAMAVGGPIIWLNVKDYIIILVFIILIILTMLFVIYEAFILICALKAGVKFIAHVAAESRRAIFHQKSTVFFLIVLYSLSSTILTIFAVAVLTRLDTHNAPLILLCCLGYFFVYKFIIYFTQMTMSDCVASWYWTMDKNTISTSIFQSTARTVRNHVGTIGFASTSILPFIHAIYVAFTWSRNHGKKYEHEFFRFICKIHLIFNISQYSLVQTSIHGYNYCRSSRKTFDLALQNCSKILGVTTMACNVVMFILYTSICLFTLTIALLNQRYFESEYYEHLPAIILIFLIYSIIEPFCWMQCIAAKTIILCILEDLQENNGSSEKPYYMNYKLQRILIRSSLL